MWIARKLAGKRESRQWKWGVRMAVVLVFVLIPTWDMILGRVYLNHLCSTEAGVKVYQTVELPAEYWDKEGRPRFMNARGVINMVMLGDRFKWHQVREPYINGLIKIDKRRWQLEDITTQKALGEKVDFVRYFGWLNRFSPAPNVSESCPDIEIKQEKSILHGIFKPATSIR
ncbi:MAG: hypothetical protein A2W28_09385 [Gammaproteobacteria bacterium RBG_16_51_14]|nr:MAG: hypothetical protein A2W28_09385 [Gammaproteobacteria bacterium RBG_16_51_14]